MKATAQNEKTARAIISVLAENGSTISEASEILRYVDSAMKRVSYVNEALANLFEVEQEEVSERQIVLNITNERDVTEIAKEFARNLETLNFHTP